MFLQDYRLCAGHFLVMVLRQEKMVLHPRFTVYCYAAIDTYRLVNVASELPYSRTYRVLGRPGIIRKAR